MVVGGRGGGRRFIDPLQFKTDHKRPLSIVVGGGAAVAVVVSLFLLCVVVVATVVVLSVSHGPT